MDTPRFRKTLAEVILTAVLITGVAMVMGPVLSEPVFAESPQNEAHVTPIQICDYSGCFFPNPNYGTSVCQDVYGYIYTC
jgi:hypothetical protein